MKKSLRAFGIGLFLAGASFTIYEKIEGPLSDHQKAEYTKEIEQLQADLKEAQRELEKASQASDEKQNDPKEQKQETTDSSSEETKNTEDIVYGSIYIYEGVSLYDIGKQAEDVGIVNNGRELELFLYKQEYARSIQKGQFDLNSSMTIEEIAKIITGKKITE